MKIPIFPGKYHQNGEFSMAMLVYRRVPPKKKKKKKQGTLLGTNISPTSRHFWVDDFPNFPCWWNLWSFPRGYCWNRIIEVPFLISGVMNLIWAVMKTLLTFHYTGWLIGILILAYYNPLYNWVVFHPLYQSTNQGELNTAHIPPNSSVMANNVDRSLI